MSSIPLSLARPAADHPFGDKRAEVYARCRAAGASIVKSAEEAGIAKSTAQKLEKDEDFGARMAELRSSRQEFTTISRAAIIQQFWSNAKNAAEVNDFKASNQALTQLIGLIDNPGKVPFGLATMGIAAPKRDQLRETLGTPVLEAEIAEEEPDAGEQ